MDAVQDRPRYPEVTVRLVGEDGNALSIVGRTRHALRRAGVSREEIQKYTDQALSNDYDNVIRTTMEWVGVE